MLGRPPGRSCQSVWRMGDDFLDATGKLTYGDMTDLSNYGGAVIDQRSFAKNVKAIEIKERRGSRRGRRRRIRRQRRLFRPPHRAALRRPDRRAFRDGTSARSWRHVFPMTPSTTSWASWTADPRTR